MIAVSTVWGPPERRVEEVPADKFRVGSAHTHLARGISFGRPHGMGGGHRNGVRLFVHDDSSHHHGRYTNRVTRRRLRPRQWSSPVAEALGKRHRGQKAKSNGRFVVTGETSFRTESRIFLETLVCRRRSVSFGLLRLGSRERDTHRRTRAYRRVRALPVFLPLRVASPRSRLDS